MRLLRRPLVPLLGVLAVVLVLQVVKPPVTAAIPGVAGGDETDTATHPSVVGVVVNYRAQGLASRCGGTVVGPWHVITAAHCIDTLLPDDGNEGAPDVPVEVISGRDDLDAGGGDVSPVTHIWIPEATRGRPDLALLTVEKELTATPLPMASAADAALYAPGTTVSVLGYSDNKGASPSARLRAAQLSIRPDSDCVAPRDWYVCAGSPQASTCPGDSGGPLILQGKLAGVLSGGVGDSTCGNSRKITAFTRVSTFADQLCTQMGMDGPCPGPHNDASCSAEGLTGTIRITYAPPRFGRINEITGVHYKIDPGTSEDGQAEVHFADYGTLPVTELDTTDGRGDKHWHPLREARYTRGAGSISARFVSVNGVVEFLDGVPGLSSALPKHPACTVDLSQNA